MSDYYHDKLKAIHPTGSCVMVKKIKDVDSQIIHIPDGAMKHSSQFEVIAVGPTVSEPGVKVGGFVFVTMASAWHLQLPGQRSEWFMCYEGDIIGICEHYSDKEMAKRAKEASRAA